MNAQQNNFIKSVYGDQQAQRLRNSAINLFLFGTGDSGKSTIFKRFLVDYTKEKDNILGARMMGGGFGGCTINLAKQEGLDDFIEEISTAYKKETGIVLKTFITEIVQGAGMIEN